MDISLPGPWVFARLLEFNEEGPSTWDQEQTIGPTIVPIQVQFDAGYAHFLQRLGHNPLLDVLF